MAEEEGTDQRDDTHAQIDCPGCGYGGKIGVPRNDPDDVVVCPTCRQVVRPRPEDRVIWRPADAELLLCPRSSDLDQKTSGQCNEPRESRATGKPAACRRSRAVSGAGRKPVRPRVSEWFDKEPVQFALIIAAGILPLALAIFLPRAMYRVDALDHQQVALCAQLRLRCRLLLGLWRLQRLWALRRFSGNGWGWGGAF